MNNLCIKYCGCYTAHIYMNKTSRTMHVNLVLDILYLWQDLRTLILSILCKAFPHQLIWHLSHQTKPLHTVQGLVGQCRDTGAWDSTQAWKPQVIEEPAIFWQWRNAGWHTNTNCTGSQALCNTMGAFYCVSKQNRNDHTSLEYRIVLPWSLNLSLLLKGTVCLGKMKIYASWVMS